MLQKRIDSYVNSAELTGHFYLAAAKDGIVTECTAREGEVIAARTPILSIFNPKDTYAVVFFDPSDRSKLFRGQDFDVTVQGMAKGVTATLTDFYPELSALPSSLTRFFWQREMWSQYVPARLEFTNLGPRAIEQDFRVVAGFSFAPGRLGIPGSCAGVFAVVAWALAVCRARPAT